MMRIFEKSYMSWVLFALSLAAWGGVFFLVSYVSGVETSRAASEGAEEQEGMQFESALRVRSLARETREARAGLQSIAHTDVVSIVEAIEKAGRDADTELEVVAVNPGAPLPAASDEIPPVRLVEVVVEAEDSFEPLFRAASFLSVLPISSSLSQVRLEKLPSSVGGGWRLVARMQVLTTVDIAS